MAGGSRAEAHGFLNRLISAPDDQLSELAYAHLTPDCIWDIAHPINRLTGIEAILQGLIIPLREAIGHIHRRDEIFIGGTDRLHGGNWVASVTHYVGNFNGPLFGIAPCDHLVFLRSGEFYRIENDKIVNAKLIIDFLDLMRQAGCSPWSRGPGAEMLFPAPATHDGVLPDGTGARSERSLDLVENMLGELHEYDPATFHSGGEAYWHDDMLWYGPGGVGANYRWEGFQKDHRVAFLTAFPDRKGGDHYCRIGDGNYVAFGGWPSMTMTHRGDYLGVRATGKSLTLRVMDFYRCADNKITENWVLLDYLDLFNQMGEDLITRATRTNEESDLTEFP